MKKLYILLFVLLMMPFAFANLNTSILYYYALDETSGTAGVNAVGGNNLIHSDAGITDKSGQINKSIGFLTGNRFSVQTNNSGITGTSNRSISFWLKFGDTSVVSGYPVILNIGTPGVGSGTAFGLVIYDATNQIWFLGQGGSYNFNTGFTKHTDWRHYTLTYDGTTTRVYQNAGSPANGTPVLNTTNTPLRTGYISGGFPRATFYIDEIAVWNRVLNNVEITELYELQRDNNESCAQYPAFTCSNQFSITAINSKTSSVILSFNATINDVFYSTTNGTIITPYLKNESFLANIVFNSNGYFQRTYSSYTTDTDLQGQLNPIGLLELQIKNQATNNLITDLINITLQSSTQEFNYQTSNGTYPLTGLSLDEPYNIFLNSASYNSNQYTFTYTQSTPDPYVMYMAVNTTVGEEITFNVLNTQNTPINDVTVAVQKFVNGTYQTISQKTTDLSGDVIFVLQQGVTHRITFTKSGYTTQEFITQLPLTSYSFVLEAESDFDYVGVAGGVSYFYQPSSFHLTPSATQPFNFTVASSSADIFNYAVSIYNGTTLLTQASGNTPTGGTAALTFDTTPYNNSQLRAIYSFTKANYTQYQLTVYYTIQDQSSQSVFSMRDFAINNISLRDRIIIWSVIMLALILIFALLGNALAVLFIVAALAPIVAWVVGLSSIVIGFMSALLIIGILANRGSFT
jgi:hypothetical protein